MTNSWIRWSQHCFNSVSVFSVCFLTRPRPQPPRPQGWSDHSSKCSTQLELIWGQVSGCGWGEERWAGGCHGDAGRWRERVVHSGVTWHILQHAERIIVQPHLCVCPLGSAYWATLIRESGTHGAWMLQFRGGNYTFRWVCVCKSASIYSMCMCWLYSHGEK